MNIHYLGTLNYEKVWDMQKTLCQQRANGQIPDTLLLLEHPHTFTFGRSGKREHLLVEQSTLQTQDIALHIVDRGGDITYHGPGQLVGYPIVDLKDYQLDCLGYLRQLEAILIQTLATYQQQAYREAGYTGVWVPAAGPVRSAKIAAMGVKVNASNITSHGFAINLNTDLRYFDMIVPCGIRQCRTTSLAYELKKPIDISMFISRLNPIFEETFAQFSIQKRKLYV